MPCCTTAHSPSACQHERMQVDLKAVGDRVVVDARGQPAGAHQRVAVEAGRVGDRRAVRRACCANACRGRRRRRRRARAARGLSPRLQRAHHRRRDAGGVPVHAHHAAECLEPERIAQSREERRATVVMRARSRRSRCRASPSAWPATPARGRRAAADRRRRNASSRYFTRLCQPRSSIRVSTTAYEPIA